MRKLSNNHSYGLTFESAKSKIHADTFDVPTHKADKKLVIDYKDGKALTAFTTERGKLVPRRISGNCAKHQREVTEAIKRARILALIPYTATQVPMI